MKQLTRSVAHKVYDILLEYGALEEDRYSFVEYMMKEDVPHEYRFCGIFGFGGKCRLDCYDGLYATYYPENRTLELDIKLRELNEKLKTFDLEKE